MTPAEQFALCVRRPHDTGDVGEEMKAEEAAKRGGSFLSYALTFGAGWVGAIVAGAYIARKKGLKLVKKGRRK